ncbi:DMT family transporter [Brevifollis gellanilyticus]|uniref:Permease n=1 Tax=Brevifollis gellanilyticus TaxID=748831 RepID=A0A512M7M3_9BACT|nr:DMT family transporter [Brevifollis gellanilyticus]GEP42737.1 permease [Brevifollis gellanilyticus]
MRDYLKLHLVIVAWGFTAILGKLIDMPPIEMLVWRTALAAVGFTLVARWQGQSLAMSKGERSRMILLGGLLGLHWILFFISARLSTASVCLAAMPTGMLWCSLVEPWINKTRRWRPLELVVGLVIVGAVWLIYEVEFRYWLGFSVALGAAFLAALFAVISKQLVARCHYAVMGTYQMSGACVVSIIGWLGLEHGHVTVPGVDDLLWLFLFASICTVWAYAGYMDVLKRLSMFTVNVIYNLEPIYGIALAALIFGQSEYMSTGFYIGAAIIIGSVVLVPWLERWVDGQKARMTKP